MSWHSLNKISDNDWKITFGAICSDKLLENYFKEYEEFISNQKQKIIVHFDLSNIKSITILQILKNVFFLNKMKSIHKQNLSSFKLIIPNYYLSKLMVLTFILSPPVVPCEIIENFT